MPPKRTKAAKPKPKPSAAVTPKRQPLKGKSAKGKSPARGGRARGNLTTVKSPKAKSPKGKSPARPPKLPAKPSKLYFEFVIYGRVYKGTYTYAEFMPNCVRYLALQYAFLPKELLTARARDMWEKKACEVSGCETALQRKVRLYMEAKDKMAAPPAVVAPEEVNHSRVRRQSLFDDDALNTSSSNDAHSRVKRPNLFDEQDDDDVQYDNVGQLPKQPETRHLVTKKVRRLEPDQSPPRSPQVDRESKGGWTLCKSLLASTPLPIPSPTTRARNAAVLKKKLTLSEADSSPSSPSSSAHNDAHSESPFSSPDPIREGRLAAKKPPGNSDSSEYEIESASGENENDEHLMPPPATIPHKSKLNINSPKQQQAASSESDSQSSGELVTSQSSDGPGSSQTGDTTTSADETIDVSSTTAEPSIQPKTSRIKTMIAKNLILVSSDNDSGVKAADTIPHISALQEFPTGKERLLTTTIERVATTTDESQSDRTDASGSSSMTQVKPLPPLRVMFSKAFIPLQLRQDVNNNYVEEEKKLSDDATSSDDSI